MPKTVRFHKLGGPEVLEIEDLPKPIPGHGEVLIKVHAIGINRAEIMFHEEEYTIIPKFPALLGYEAAGVIEALGENSDKFQVGDRVSVLPFDTNTYGTYGEYILMPEKYLTSIPSNLSFRESAASWMQYMTAYGALIGLGKLTKNKRVLITGGSSSAALGAVQIAKSVGATVITTTRTEEKKKALLDNGADYVIVTDYKNIAQEIFDATDGEGVNLIYDCVGNALIEQWAGACAEKALICIYGTFQVEAKPLPIFEFFRKQLMLRFYSMTMYYHDMSMMEEACRYIYSGLERGILKPVIDNQKFNLDQIKEAQNYMKSTNQVGKIIVDVL